MRVKLLATMAMSAMAAACADKPEPVFANTTFSVARAGSTISIPFTVDPSVDLEHRYMLAFKFMRPVHGDPTMVYWGAQMRNAFRLRVTLVRIENGHESRVRVHDHVATCPVERDTTHCNRESMASRRTDVAYVSMHGHANGETLMEVVYFRLPDRGIYRFDVETLDDMPMFDRIDSRLTVEREYSHVK